MDLKVMIWIMTIIYLSILLIMGWVADRKKIQTGGFSEYALMGKNLGGPLLMFTFLASMFGMTTFVGQGDKGAAQGLSWLTFVWGEQGGKVIFALVLAKYVSKFQFTTISEFLNRKVVRDRVTMAICGILLCTLGMAWMGAQASAIGTLFNIFTGGDQRVIAIIAGIVIIAYTTMGGIVSVVWNDFFQGVIMCVIALVYFYFCFDTVDFSIANLKGQLDVIDPKLWSFAGVSTFALISQFMSAGMAQFCYQVTWQRCFASRNPRQTKVMYMWTGIITATVVSLTTICGMIALVNGAGAGGNVTGLTLIMIRDMAPTWMILAMFLLIAAATLSTADSFLNSGAINIVNDVIMPQRPEMTDKQKVKTTKIVTIIMGTLSMIGAMRYTYILDYAALGYTICGATVCPLIIIGLIWKKDRSIKGHVAENCRVTKEASRVALIAGAVVAVIFQEVASLKTVFAGGIIPGAVTTVVLLVVVSLVTQKRDVLTDELVAEAEAVPYEM